MNQTSARAVEGLENIGARPVWLPKIISGLAQLPSWATLIAGMIGNLKLLGGLLVGVFRSHAARESRDRISPPAACRPEAVRASKAQAAHRRSPDLRLALSAVPFRAPSRGCLQA